MRRTILVALVMFAMVPVASAHVHGITLSGEGLGHANSGGNGTNGTPANAARGGPITRSISRDVGNARIEIGDGGFRPANNPRCG